MTAVRASFISFSGIWSGTVDLLIFSNSTFLCSDRWDTVISFRGGGSALQFRIKSGSQHSIAVGGCRSSSANVSPIVEKYQFITAPPPICNQSSTTYCSNLNYIYLLQKRIVRLISKAHYLANTAPLFSKLKVLDIYSIYSFSVATFMYSYHYNLLPSSFRNLFLSRN